MIVKPWSVRAVRVNQIFPVGAGIAFFIFAILPLSTVYAVDGNDGLKADITVEGDRTKVCLRISEDRLTREVSSRVPDSFPLPDQSFGDFVLWKHVRLQEMSGTIDRSSIKVQFDAQGHIGLSAAADVSGKPRYEYLFTKVSMEMRKIGFVKTKVPVLTAEMRTDTGSFSTHANATAGYSPTVKLEGDKVMLVLDPVVADAHLQVGELKIGGIDWFLKLLAKKIGEHFAEEAAQRSFHKNSMTSREIDLSKLLAPIAARNQISNVAMKVDGKELVFNFEIAKTKP